MQAAVRHVKFGAGELMDFPNFVLLNDGLQKRSTASICMENTSIFGL